MGYTDDVLNYKIKELICASIDRLSNQDCPRSGPSISYEDIAHDLDQGDMFCNKIMDLLVYELADRRRRSRASNRGAICERTAYALRHLSRSSTVLGDRNGLHYDQIISEAYSSNREPDVSFINLDGPRLHPYSEDDEERLLSDFEVPHPHTTALHDVYSVPTFHTATSRPISPPFDENPVEESHRPRLARRTNSFADFLELNRQTTATQHRNTDIVRRPTLHRRDLDFPSRRRNRSRATRAGVSSSTSQSNEGSGLWAEYERSDMLPAPFSRRGLRNNSEDNVSTSYSRPAARQNLLLRLGSQPGTSSSSSSRLRRGGIQPPEVIGQTGRSSTEGPPNDDATNRRSERVPLVGWYARSEHLASLPTPRSTSPDTFENEI